MHLKISHYLRGRKTGVGDVTDNIVQEREHIEIIGRHDRHYYESSVWFVRDRLVLLIHSIQVVIKEWVYTSAPTSPPVTKAAIVASRAHLPLRVYK